MNRENLPYLERDLEYYLEEIRETDKCPFQMNNRELSLQLFERVKKEYPDAKYFSYDNTYYGTQWIVVSNTAEKLLANQLETMEKRRTKELEELRKLMEEVKGNA